MNAEPASASADVGLRPLLVDAKQAARLLGIGRTTLYELIKAGAVTTVYIGRCVRFPVAELEGFVARACVTDPEVERSPLVGGTEHGHAPERAAHVTRRLLLDRSGEHAQVDDRSSGLVDDVDHLADGWRQR